MSWEYAASRAVDEFKLILTCGACPEQYDVFKDGQKVGYLRLRHGYFAAYSPSYNGELVYESEPNGDGIFDDGEREDEIMNALICLRKALK